MGNSDVALLDFVQTHCPKTSSNRLVSAALLALTDPHVKDSNILLTIYALAIKERTKELGGDTGQSDKVAAETVTALLRTKTKKEGDRFG